LGKIKLSLAAARINAKYSRDEVAEKMHVSTRTIQAWEIGESEPKVSQAYELSSIYGLPIDVIFLPKNLANSEEGD
jgi:DNA-binding XRE family transcriptional regulator